MGADVASGHRLAEDVGSLEVGPRLSPGRCGGMLAVDACRSWVQAVMSRCLLGVSVFMRPPGCSVGDDFEVLMQPSLR